MLQEQEDFDFDFKVGDKFIKTRGDYSFAGEIRAIFRKKDGLIRIVGENSDGLLFIFNLQSIQKVSTDEE